MQGGNEILKELDDNYVKLREIEKKIEQLKIKLMAEMASQGVRVLVSDKYKYKIFVSVSCKNVDKDLLRKLKLTREVADSSKIKDYISLGNTIDGLETKEGITIRLNKTLDTFGQMV